MDSGVIRSQPCFDEDNKPRVLVVDDEKFAQIIVKQILAKQNCDILFVESGEEALRILHEDHRVDLVFLDLLMVGMDGYEVLSAMRADPLTKDIKVIVMSGLEGEEDIKKALETGANDFISKPFQPDVLIKKFQTLVCDK